MDDRTDPTRSNEPARYDRDIYGWAVEQAALLRAGKIAEADALNIAEELDDVGSRQYDRLESAVRAILLHLLKWDHRPEQRTRNWQADIEIQRHHVRKVLRKNPGLKPLLDEAAAEAYEIARLEAAVEMDCDKDSFALKCLYSWDAIMDRAVHWPPKD